MWSFAEARKKRRHRRAAALFDLPTAGSVLDLSCGDGELLEALHAHRPRLRYFGCDQSEMLIQNARSRCPWGDFLTAQAEALPYERGSMDAVLSCMSLHHYRDPAKVFAEAACVLKADGRLYILDEMPRYRWSQWIANGIGCSEPYHFEKYYLVGEVERLARAAGLIVQRVRLVSRLRPIRVVKFCKE